MSFMTDALDVLGNGGDNKPPTQAPNLIKQKIKTKRKPEGMHRELYSLICDDNKEPPPMMVSDYTPNQYITSKANFNKKKKVRKWAWAPFIHMERKDNLKLYHWQREEDLQSNKPYPFAKFNKTIDIPTFTDEEYDQYLTSDKWTRQETYHLMDLAKRFNLSFPIMNDRWDKSKFGDDHFSIEDLKERYFEIHNTLSKARTPPNVEPKLWVYDAAHERKRKQQLINLWNRTPQQIEEEQHLLQELKKIEARKRERERKSQDLQKLISAADTNLAAQRYKKLVQGANGGGNSTFFYDHLPASLKQQVDRNKYRQPLKYQSLKTVVAGDQVAYPTNHSNSASSTKSSSQPFNYGNVDVKNEDELASNHSSGINSQDNNTDIVKRKRADETSSTPGYKMAANFKRLKSSNARTGGGSSLSRHQGGGQKNSKHGKLQSQQMASFDQGFIGIKFPDSKFFGAYLRSNKMKLPISLGQKKTKVIEQALADFGLELHPPATEEIVESFNQLRSDIVLLYELKSALTNTEYEIQYQKHYLESLRPSDASSHADDEASSVGENTNIIKEEPHESNKLEKDNIFEERLVEGEQPILDHIKKEFS